MNVRSTIPTLAVAGALAVAFPVTTVAQRGEEGEKKNLPLEGERTVSFTTDEGTWISLDVSPDGQTLVFDLLGDLYTVSLTGGRATQLTSGMAFDAQPRFSPDGAQVVFTSDRDGGENVWVMAVDGSDTKQITKGKTSSYRSPEWTPNGKYIIASKGGNSKLWMYHLDGGSGVALVSEPDNLKMVGPAFGSEGRYIWYSQRFNNWRYNAQFPQYQLAVYDRETGERFTRSSRYGSAFRPTLSPDGNSLVYGTRHEADTGLRIRDLRTGDERWLAYPVQRDDQESSATRDVLPAMSFTPDSREVVASYGGKIWRIPIDGSDPIAVPFELDVSMEIGPLVDFDYQVSDEPTFIAQQIRDVAPSPDGSRVAFVALDRLWVKDFPDGAPERVTQLEMAEHHPTWSPDGRWIGFVSWSDDGGGSGGGHIYKTRSDRDGGTERLTQDAGFYQRSAWSPDGARIVAVRTAARNFEDAIARGGSSAGSEIVWVDADEGGPVTSVTPASGIARPHFTQDADRIYAYQFDTGLISMRWDGTDIKEHVQVKGATLPGASNPINASLIMMAPQGDQALAQVLSDLYVVTVPVVGGDTPRISISNPDNASFPARKLTVVGGQFPAWEADGRRVHWSIGNAHHVYDLDDAKVFEDSVDTAKKAEEAEEAERDTLADSLQAEADSVTTDEGQEEEKEEDDKYRAVETRIEILGQRDIPQGVAVLRGARVITMRGDEVIENADIIVRNNRIAAVGRSGAVTVPDGARVIDISGKTVIPGFVDTHAHLRPMYEIHKTQVWSYLANLAYGVTTTRDPQTATTDVLSYEDMVEAGAILGPRIYSTGPGVFGSEQIRDQEHANNILKRYSAYYDTKTIKMYVSGNRQQRQWIITAARKQRIMPTTEGALDAKLNLTNTIDGYPGMEHSFPLYPVYKDVIELFAQAGRTYTPTLLVAYGGPWGENYFYATEEVHDDAKLRHFTPHAEIDQKSLRRGGGAGQAGWFRPEQHIFKRHAEFVRNLIAAGGRVGVGSHGQLQGLAYHWELWALQSGGLPEHDALRVATIFGAEAIGLDQHVGSVVTGKLADLIVLNENPLEDLRNTNTIQYVMKNGRLYEGDTLNELWPRQRPLEGIHWWNEGPNVAAGMRNR